MDGRRTVQGVRGVDQQAFGQGGQHGAYASVGFGGAVGMVAECLWLVGRVRIVLACLRGARIIGT